MPEKISCETHGETDQTFVCAHLPGNTSALGFNCEEPTDEMPFPDAWCDDCEIIRSARDGWDEIPDELIKIVLICSGCYERARIRNTRPSVTLDDLANLRWKCSSCEEWHQGPCLDFGVSEPHYWSKNYEPGTRWSVLPSGAFDKSSKTFLDEDYCAIDDENFFVRGIIQLPIIGTAETFEWGVWGSLSRDNFETLLRADHESQHIDPPPMFSWLSSQLSDYPDTLNLKMYAHVQEPGMRPHFRVEPTDHPLSQEYHHGIAPERVKEIMLRGLKECDQA
jgi:hypothetical protein